MTATIAAPRSAAELADLLRTRPGRVRLVGSGSRQDRLGDAGGALRVQLTGIATIARLDAADQTCSVDCGVRREELDAALAPVGLELPCFGGGTLGGLFASDPIGPAAPAAPSPRSLLLGLDAVLADGTPWKAGARVVKSVAGFDVHKLLVGSRGRLFVATRLHLRLAPRPRAEQWFAQSGLDAARAVALVHELRAAAVGPTALQLVRAGDGACTVLGRLAGRASHVAAMLRAHALTGSAPAWRDDVDLPLGGETIAGLALPSALPGLLAALPFGARLTWHGGGRFAAAVGDAAAGDTLLAALAAAGLPAAVERGPLARRGLGPPIDAGHRRLEQELHRALDPDGILV